MIVKLDIYLDHELISNFTIITFFYFFDFNSIIILLEYLGFSFVALVKVTLNRFELQNLKIFCIPTYPFILFLNNFFKEKKNKTI